LRKKEMRLRHAASDFETTRQRSRELIDRLRI
jgi:hypothetical protein